MVQYSLEAVNALLNIGTIDGWPTFHSLWTLAHSIYDALRKLDHPDHPTNGWSGYLMTREEYALRSPNIWQDPEDVGKYFKTPPKAITTGDQKAAKGECTYKHKLQESHDTIKMALKALFERVIDKAYHTTGTTGLMGNGFGQLTPYEILKKMWLMYGRPTVQEIKQNLLVLHNSMDRNLPVEVMLKDIEDVQRFLLANPVNKMEMSQVQLILYGLIKLSKTGVLYAKAVERWNAKDLYLRQVWLNFKTHFVEQYEKMLVAGGGTSIGMAGCGTGFSAVEDDAGLLAESIVQYAERASMAEGKVSDLEGRLAALEMVASTTQTPVSMYHAPHAAYNAVPQTMSQPPPMNVHVPSNAWQQQQGGNTRRYGGQANGGQRRRTDSYQGGGRGKGGGGRCNGNNQNRNFSNTTKQHLNLLYCFSCGYDLDHDGYNCPPNCQKRFHLPHVKRDDAHMYERACMKAQHKTLPDGSGAGKGWIMTKHMEKG